MNLNLAEQHVRRAGAGAILLALASIFPGIGRGLRRPAAGTAGRFTVWLRRPLFLLLTGTGYFALCWRLWRPLPVAISRPLRAAALIAGSLLYFPGLALVLWSRLTLAEMYYVSGSFGAQLFTGHRLITGGPFAYVRHPMYLGILLVALGGLLLYRTWTFVFLLANVPALVIRACREEAALAEAFGEQWATYCEQVPPWLPQIRVS
jgi:protein-S-isoprenylcysteine O-methyltransferase Ste14